MPGVPSHGYAGLYAREGRTRAISQILREFIRRQAVPAQRPMTGTSCAYSRITSHGTHRNHRHRSTASQSHFLAFSSSPSEILRLDDKEAPSGILRKRRKINDSRARDSGECGRSISKSRRIEPREEISRVFSEYLSISTNRPRYWDSRILRFAAPRAPDIRHRRHPYTTHRIRCTRKLA
ncbi:hypothetical protein BTHE_1550 [Bifidobacterium thermophilum]|nr:hypothetical protein BTHE_1550 [Bifidobacterium thermophilum]